MNTRPTPRSAHEPAGPVQRCSVSALEIAAALPRSSARGCTRADHERHIRRSVSSRYRGRLRHYSRFKLRHDPVYAAVAPSLIEFGMPVLDIGSGIGLLGFYLRASGFRARYLGIDCDSGKVAAARRIADDHGLALAFQARTAAVLPEFHGAVAMLDILHYLEHPAQQALLGEAAARVAPGAALVVRTVLREPRWRYRATVLEECLLHAVGWMQMPARHFPNRADIEAPLLALGLAVEISPLWGRTPFASFLIVARRAAL